MPTKNDPTPKPEEQLTISEYANPSMLVERAIRPDGTTTLRIIGEGWGSSGYYGRQVLERDIPREFPAGTHMYWNHPTMTELTERPERDLNDLAAVIITDPTWLQEGPEGPGMYADAAVFQKYSSTVDDIAEHIGVSIHGGGVKQKGEAEGQEGWIVTEINRGDSVDFVTKPGAGGRIVKLFESAGNGRLPDPKQQEKLKEAANLGEWIEAHIHMRTTVLTDHLFADGYVNQPERMALSKGLGDALKAFRKSIMSNATGIYKRSRWQQADDSPDIPPDDSVTGVSESMEDSTMSEEQLREATNQLEEANKVIADMRRNLAIEQGRTAVRAALANVELPKTTLSRLEESLLLNVPTNGDGNYDGEKFQKLIADAVAGAEAEIAEATGNTGGKVKDNGDAGEGEDTAVTLTESRKTLNDALAEMGYGGSNNG